MSEPIAGPGETLFETENARFSNEETRKQDEGSFFVPAALSEPSEFLVPAQLMPASAPPKAATVKKGKKHAHSPNKNMMDDYFNEGEQKSRELDRVPSGATKAPLSAPPKAGAPPTATSSPPKAAASVPEASKESAYDSGVD